MGTELTLQTGTLYAFLLVLARVSGAFIFVPLPGIGAGPELARVALAVSMTLALFPRWPLVHPEDVGMIRLFGWLVSEAGLGIAAGILVSILSEVFQMGAQIIGLQAGFSFASTVDPTSGADSSILIFVAQTLAGILFFATGLDREVILAFAQSLSIHPPGQVALNLNMAKEVMEAASAIFSIGLRLVLPIVALLVMVDLSLALLARLNAQLQLITLAFPIKMLMAVVLMAWLVLVFPKMMTQTSGPIFRLMHQLLG